MSRITRRIFTAGLSAALVVTLAGPVGAAQLGHGAALTTKTVVMKDDLFRAKTVTISKGTAVKWVNKGESAHTTTSRKGLWDKSLSPGKSYTRTFKKLGTFKYYCKYHDGMTGKIIVA